MSEVSITSVKSNKRRVASVKGSKPVRKTSKMSRLLKFSIFLCVAIVFIRHPRTVSIATDLLSPADRLLTELDKWGNFTMTTRIRSAISDMFDNGRSELDIPFYMDIITNSTITMRRPVLCIPGYITSGLEVWANLPCAKTRFRDRIWGTANMVKLFITDPGCWVQHMLLIPEYGQSIDGIHSVHWKDPEGIKVKPASGLAAADFLLGDYWVWNPIFEALASAGYDENLMSMMSYDWRLPARDLEVRDKFFTRMKLEIEKLVKLNEQQVFLVTHSFGCKLWFFFLKWIEHHHTVDWVDEHVYGTYNVAPVLLGVPKAYAALLSGDTRDTAQLGAMSTLVDTMLPPRDRSALTSAWGSIVDMLPEGGDAIWPEPLLFLNNVPRTNSEANRLLFQTTSMVPHAHHRLLDPARLRCASDEARLVSCYKDEWTRPLSTPLPAMAKSLVWCTYGVGIPTEVGYYYTAAEESTDNGVYRIATSLSNGTSVVNGVILADGDGSVPTQSLGRVCSNAWAKGSNLNPGDVPVVVRELHHGDSYSLLGRSTSMGGSSVDHVDIMGNRFVIRDILHIALGHPILD